MEKELNFIMKSIFMILLKTNMVHHAHLKRDKL